MRYTSAHLRVSPLGARYQLVRSPGSRESRWVDGPLGQLLRVCSDFRTLEDHAQKVAPGAARADAEKHLRMLLDAGLLLSEDACLRSHDEAVRGAPVATRIESLGIVTRDRPAMLRRCLERLAPALDRAGRKPRIVIADDSSNGSGEVNRATLREVCERYGLPFHYVGGSEKSALIARLSKRVGVPSDLVAFALRGSGNFATKTGANRNALLVSTVGELTFQLDDDVEWRIARPPEVVPGVRWLRGADPTEFRFFADRTQALAAAIPTDEDGLSAHEAFLGRTLGDALAHSRAPGGALVEGLLDPAFLRKLMSGEGRVLATSFGLVGDAGMGGAHGHLHLRGKSRAELLAHYSDAVRTREVLRAARQVTLIPSGTFMSTAVGLDNRLPLPPFIPVGRAQDGLFSAMLQLCRPSGHIAHLPRVIVHQPESPRAFSPDSVWASAVELRVTTFVVLAMSALRAPHPSSDSDQMSRLGRHLEELCTVSDADLSDLLRMELWRLMDGTLKSLETNLAPTSDASEAMRRDAELQMEAIQARLASATDLSISDMPNPENPSAQLGAFRELLRSYGALLSAWPALLAAARE